MGLISDLQRGKELGPTSRKFALAHWLSLIKQSEMQSEDIQIIGLGVLFDSALTQIRSQLRFVTRTDLSAGYKRHAFIGLTNRECGLSEIILTEKLDEMYPSGSTVVMDRIATIKIDLPMGAFTVDEICQSVVDSAEQLLKMLKAPLGESSRGSETHDEWNEAANDLNLGIAYPGIESLWMDVVWNNFRIVSRSSPITLSSTTSEEQIARAISIHRHILTTTQAFAIRFSRIRSQLSQSGAGNGTSLPSVAVTIHDGTAKLSLSPPTAEMMALREAIRAGSIPEYYSPMLADPGPQSPRLTLDRVFNAYMLLTAISGDVSESILTALKRERHGSGEGLVCPISLAPRLPRVVLVKLFEDGLSVTNEVAMELVVFFTSGGSPTAEDDVTNCDLWAAPLVEVDAAHLVAVVHSLRHANTRRLVDIWLKRLGFPLDMRGTAFESHVKRSLESAIDRSDISQSSWIFLGEFEFVTTASRREEIDFLLVVGDCLVVGEVKCFLEPIAPIDWSNHHDKVVDAADQVRRKALAIQESTAEFEARARQLKFRLPASYKVLPVVVLNHALAAGQVVGGVPILDLRILEMFFEGFFQRMATISPRGEVESATVERFYSSAIEAAEVIGPYMMDPPQVRHLRRAVSPRVCQIHFPASAEGSIGKVVYEIDAEKLLPVTTRL